MNKKTCKRLKTRNGRRRGGERKRRGGETIKQKLLQRKEKPWDKFEQSFYPVLIKKCALLMTSVYMGDVSSNTQCFQYLEDNGLLDDFEIKTGLSKTMMASETSPENYTSLVSQFGMTCLDFILGGETDTTTLVTIVEDTNCLFITFRGTTTYEEHGKNLNFQSTELVFNACASPIVESLGLIDAIEVPIKQFQYACSLEGTPTHSYSATDNKLVLVHHGILSKYNDIRSKLFKALKNHEAIMREKQVVLVGHSLGGALALFCNVDVKLTFKIQTTTVVFGSPGIGNQEFVKFYNALKPISNTWRIVNKTDVVNNISFMFHHVGTLVLLGSRDPESQKQETILPTVTRLEHCWSEYLLGLYNNEYDIIAHSYNSAVPVVILNPKIRQEIEDYKQMSVFQDAQDTNVHEKEDEFVDALTTSTTAGYKKSRKLKKRAPHKV